MGKKENNVSKGERQKGHKLSHPAPTGKATLTLTWHEKNIHTHVFFQSHPCSEAVADVVPAADHLLLLGADGGGRSAPPSSSASFLSFVKLDPFPLSRSSMTDPMSCGSTARLPPPSPEVSQEREPRLAPALDCWKGVAAAAEALRGRSPAARTEPALTRRRRRSNNSSLRKSEK